MERAPGWFFTAARAFGSKLKESGLIKVKKAEPITRDLRAIQHRSAHDRWEQAAPPRVQSSRAAGRCRSAFSKIPAHSSNARLEDGRKMGAGSNQPGCSNRISTSPDHRCVVIAAIATCAWGTNAADAAKGIADFRFDFANQYQVIEITDAVVARAMALIESHKLRGYDGVQLAAALELNDNLVHRTSYCCCVVANSGLGRWRHKPMAPAEGLAVEDPQT